MFWSMLGRTLLAALAFFVLAAQPARAQSAGGEAPVVVELFTSQGCTSCPRANRILGAMARDEGVIALTFGVGYWDYLGWRDTFARPAYSNRQRNYARALRLRAPYTPQFVIGGVRQLSVSDIESAEAVAAEVRAAGPPAGSPRVSIARAEQGVRVDVGAGAARPEPADVWVVDYDPGPITVTVEGGDNSGRRVTHFNVVLDVYRAGAWSGRAEQFTYPRCTRQCAAIVQAPNGGPILAAATTRRASSR